MQHSTVDPFNASRSRQPRLPLHLKYNNSKAFRSCFNYKLWDNGLNLIKSNAFKCMEFNEENRKLVAKKKIPELVLARDENGNLYSF